MPLSLRGKRGRSRLSLNGIADSLQWNVHVLRWSQRRRRLKIACQWPPHVKVFELSHVLEQGPAIRVVVSCRPHQVLEHGMRSADVNNKQPSVPFLHRQHKLSLLAASTPAAPKTPAFLPIGYPRSDPSIDNRITGHWQSVLPPLVIGRLREPCSQAAEFF